jgi:hypothetical protein
MKITLLANLPEGQVSHNPEIKKKVMLGPGDVPHVTNFSQARFAPGQVASAHAHRDMYEVFFVESGMSRTRPDRFRDSQLFTGRLWFRNSLVWSGSRGNLSGLT